ncbi:MAG: hemerythrin domain-containing protein [Candidatus Thermoplasmatota archaeon]|nr:hemerythrin domain-containing protein [Candidatus Thermoplasmatota archaeon]
MTRIPLKNSGVNYDADSFEEFRSGLLRHIYLEEEIVFPAVLKNSPELRGQIAGLEMEHASVAMIMGKIADEIQTGNIIKSRKYLDEIERILAVHNSVESSGVYLKIPDNISMDIHSVVIPEGWVCRKLRKSRV